ncbi:MAG TPA: nickel-dependent lactate racemase [Phycisphaerae bacterium]|jgi:nickel-dependent lactate racemase|nr:nickel-dependent lactate racemase [Phycisphaerae bacterium]HPU33133.1 nickel-dependent lactate racemase [Phycisphaerae bacterium]HQA43816.1 nickel-dependent lactate racemase [Phycisphaerae bacterium]HQE42874.1 nickel-dependent lactate racemase [Phycisphaerae bacterium]HXK86240.1 nickel-dependent lactate racemase [Phycisphaerae bacterium]
MAEQQTKTVHLAYGKHGLKIEVPAHAVVIEPRYVPGLADEQAALVRALRDPIGSLPLRDLVRPGQKAVIVHTDITRATPNERILPPLLAELEAAGIRREDITLLNALGTHRPQTTEELKTMLGPEVVARYRCVQHDGRDDANLVHLGRTSQGHDVRVNRLFVEADVRILTGFIEPHFFAGFSGGPKGVLPSIAGAESVMSNHGPRMIAQPNARWGVTVGNPIWEEMLEAARMTKPTFLLNVAMNRDKQITGVFAGELFEAHQAGCRFVADSAMVPVAQPFDVVITSNSGYPLDLNLYQTVKGMSAAAQVVRPGGSIIIAAECWDGVPEHGHFGRLLREAKSAKELLARIEAPGFSSPDSWQVQILCRILLKADVYVHADGLTDEQIQAALLRPARRIEDTLAQLCASSNTGREPTICVLPEGPVTIPFVEKKPE